MTWPILRLRVVKGYMLTSGVPVDVAVTSDDLPTLGMPTSTSTGSPCSEVYG